VDFENPVVNTFLGGSEPQPEKPKKKSYERKPLVALKTCRVRFSDGTEVKLEKGCEVHGLKRQEREYLKAQKFAE